MQVGNSIKEISIMDRPAPIEIMIRPARLEDALQIAQLSAQFGYPASVDDVRLWLQLLIQKPGEGVFVGIIDPGAEHESIAAWIQVSRVVHLMEPPFAEVIGLVVAEDWRGRGIGAQMLSHAERWAAARGLKWIWVRSNIVRDRAHRFYLARNFTLAKSQNVYVKDLTAGL